MPRLVWVTDPHMNFCTSDTVTKFFESVRAATPTAVLLSGDISESESVVNWLCRIDDELSIPIYFVLGNHDYYHGSIHTVRESVSQLSKDRPHLAYLTNLGVIHLSEAIGLVGHDGWADGREGDYERSFVMMNDYRLIEELEGYSKSARWPLLMDLGDQAAAHIRRVLTESVEKYRHTFLVTHVPPWREACWYEGQISDDEWAPHFTCRAVGDAILDVMRRHPERTLTVLCGHTHGEGRAQPLRNIEVFTGAAEYGHPRVTDTFEFK